MSARRQYTEEDLLDLERFLLLRFKAFVFVKGDSKAMGLIAAAFGVLVLFGLKVPSSEEFLTRWATTLGPAIFMPRGLTDPKRRILLLLHELGHVVSFLALPIFFVRAYLGSKERRAGYEAIAERGRIEGAWLLFGELPTAAQVESFMRHGYAVDQPDAELAQDLVDIAATSTAADVITSPVGLAVREWQRSRGEA